MMKKEDEQLVDIVTKAIGDSVVSYREEKAEHERAEQELNSADKSNIFDSKNKGESK